MPLALSRLQPSYCKSLHSSRKGIVLFKDQSVGITGLVVLGGHTSVENPTANFRNAFEGTTNSGYGVTNALVKIIFSYAGYYNAFNVVNEVKVDFPMRNLLTYR